ncbi:MAG: hypothetical protein L0I71_01910 [Lacticaseibacillus paracasei]|nr:hypothetical protein [Lacticaseibacillus paracasei]
MSELATRRFGVATAKLEWWARLRAHAQNPRAVSKLGLLVGGKPPTRISDLLMQERPTMTPQLKFYMPHLPWYTIESLHRRRLF